MQSSIYTKINEFQADTYKVLCASFGKKYGKIFATGNGKNVHLWKLGQSTCCAKFLGNKTDVVSVLVDQNESTIATGSKNGSVKVFDIQTQQIINFNGHQQSVNCLCYHPFGNLLVSGSNDTYVKIWDTRDKVCVQQYNTHEFDITSVNVSIDGSTVISGDKKGILRYYNLSKASESLIVYCHQGAINDIEFHPCEKIFASAGLDKCAQFWDYGTGTKIGSRMSDISPISRISFISDGKELVTGSKSTLKLFNYDSGKLIGSCDPQWGNIGDIYITENKPDKSKTLYALSLNECHVTTWTVDLEKTRSNTTDFKLKESRRIVNRKNDLYDFNYGSIMDLKESEDDDTDILSPPRESTFKSEIMKRIQSRDQPDKVVKSESTIKESNYNDPSKNITLIESHPKSNNNKINKEHDPTSLNSPKQLNKQIERSPSPKINESKLYGDETKLNPSKPTKYKQKIDYDELNDNVLKYIDDVIINKNGSIPNDSKDNLIECPNKNVKFPTNSKIHNVAPENHIDRDTNQPDIDESNINIRNKMINDPNRDKSTDINQHQIPTKSAPEISPNDQNKSLLSPGKRVKNSNCPLSIPYGYIISSNHIESFDINFQYFTNFKFKNEGSKDINDLLREANGKHGIVESNLRGKLTYLQNYKMLLNRGTIPELVRSFQDFSDITTVGQILNLVNFQRLSIKLKDFTLLIPYVDNLLSNTEYYQIIAINILNILLTFFKDTLISTLSTKLGRGQGTISFEEKYNTCKSIAGELKKIKPKLNKLSKLGKLISAYILTIFDSVEDIIRLL